MAATSYLARFSLEGRTALVTGAARGLGFEIARALALSGAAVVLNGRDAVRLDEAAQRIAAEGGRVATAVFDIADDERAAGFLGGMERLDILVNNVGARDRRKLAQFEDAAIRRLIDTDLVAAIMLAREAAARMTERGSGRIIMITSIAGQVAGPSDAVYTAAKAGLAGLVRALAVEYGAHGITTNAIAPGFFATETNAHLVTDKAASAYFEGRTPLARWGRPDEIAGAAVFLASDAASYVNGHVLVVDGGATVRM